ncbi:hypothetical protein [Stenotrophomonas sp.]|uniref:hypothetical protein n=1 Tax=Stenotrophomonas sp. TaxID=69392 RepID=UPI002FC62784
MEERENPALNAKDIVILRHYASQGNRELYFNYLAQKRAAAMVMVCWHSASCAMTMPRARQQTISPHNRQIEMAFP